MKNKQLAKAVLKKYWDGKLPVDPKRIAIALKAKVVEDPQLGPISGQFKLTEESAEIRFNPNEPIVRQRFTVAHELGHYVLSHGDYFRDPLKNFSASNFDSKEVAANKFAAEILMPEQAVNKMVKVHGLTNIGELAREFQVSEVAMKYRLKNLGWVS